MENEKAIKFENDIMELVEMKKKIKELEKQYKEKTEIVKSSYIEMWTHEYQLAWTEVVIQMKTRTSYKYVEWITDQVVFDKYPQYVIQAVDKKRMQVSAPELFEEKRTDYISITWL